MAKSQRGADVVGITFDSCQAIRLDILGMKPVAAKFVPRSLHFN